MLNDPRLKSALLGASFLLFSLSFSNATSPRPESARPYGMGNAFTAVANDYSAILFNPAGLASIHQMEIAGQGGRAYSPHPFPQSELHLDATFPLEAYRKEWNYGTAGFLIHRTGRQGDNTVTNAGVAFGANLGQQLPKGIPLIGAGMDNLSAGLAIRARDISGTYGTGFGLGADLGFLYKFDDGASPTTSGWSAGLSVLEMNTKSISTPVTYRLGLAWKSAQSVLSFDYAQEAGVGKFFPGVEVSFFRRILLVRAGSVEPLDGKRQLTTGLGIMLPPIQLDLAYGFQIEKPSEPNDRFLLSFTYRFGAPMLAQYLYQERVDKGDEIENKVANLEAKKKTLTDQVSETRDLLQAMQIDLELAKTKTADAQKQMTDMQNLQQQKQLEIDRLELQIRQLTDKRRNLERLEADRREEERIRSGIRPPRSGPPRRHKVVSGDTLRGIALKYYGDSNIWQVIYDENENKIIRGVPKEGEELVIP